MAEVGFRSERLAGHGKKGPGLGPSDRYWLGRDEMGSVQSGRGTASQAGASRPPLTLAPPQSQQLQQLRREVEPAQPARFRRLNEAAVNADLGAQATGLAVWEAGRCRLR